MWNLFKKKDKGVEVIDLVWTNSTRRFEAAAEYCLGNPGTDVILWFEDTLNEWEAFCTKNGYTINSHLGQHIHNRLVPRQRVIFLEHYPIATVEQSLYKQLGLTQATVYNSLDDVVFTIFGGEKIRLLMQKLGMNEMEVIQHSFISTSIAKAQEKLETKAPSFSSMRSKADWLKLKDNAIG